MASRRASAVGRAEIKLTGWFFGVPRISWTELGSGTDTNAKQDANVIMALAMQAGFYFADPYSAWQRGSNENANGLIRQYLPRAMEFSTISEEQLRWIEQRLYNRPRKALGFKTPLEVFSEELVKTVANQS